MNRSRYVEKARSYVEMLSGVQPNRRTGSAGNRDATKFVANTMRALGYEVDDASFESLDYACRETALTHGEHTFEVFASPYSPGCDVSAGLVVVSTVEELRRAECEGKILLMKGALCTEQLMPKNFVFYNPPHHQEIIALLESRRPAAIVTATAASPEQVGALSPFPLITDGDFDIPSVYCRDSEGERLAAHGLASREGGQTRADEQAAGPYEQATGPFHLRIDAERIPSTAANVIARRKTGASAEGAAGPAGKIVITAHIDAYEDSPGASDNASGTAVLLVCGEMLSDYAGRHSVEIAAFNGEDHYSAGGEMDYLERYGEELSRIAIVINVDDVGYTHGRTSYSFYECSEDVETRCRAVFGRFGGFVHGEEWYSGDHMIFVQKGIPAVALTAELMPELMRTVTHTAADTPGIIDYDRLVEVAEALDALVRSL